MKEISIAVVYASRFGHTKIQAEKVAEGAASAPGVKVALYTVEEAAKAMTALDAAQGIVFGAPTYMGSVSWEMKKFLEATVRCWFSRAWRNKIAGGFTNSSNFSGDKLMTLQEIFIAAMQLGMLWCGIDDLVAANEPLAGKSVEGPSSKALNRNSASIGPMASSFQVKAPDAPPSGDLETAFRYGRRIADVATIFYR